MQIHLHEVKILQIHNARPEFVKNITAINQSKSNILIEGVLIQLNSFRSPGDIRVNVEEVMY